MIRKMLILVIISSISFTLPAQNAKISGTITDATSQEALIAATVKIGDNGTATDLEGRYELSLDAGTYTLVASYIGYEDQVKKITVNVGEVLNLNFELTQGNHILETATVTSGKYEKPLGEVTVSLEVLQPNLIESTAKTSIDRALEKVPGVTILDGQANIRGGSGYSQGAGSRVLLLVDDMPILSADAGFPNWDDVPIENIEQIEVLKGASSALYGSSALNGIINVRTAYAKSEPETKASILYNHQLDPKEKERIWWEEAPATISASLTHKQKFKKLDLVVGGFYIDEEEHNKDSFKKYGRFNFSTRYRATDQLYFGLNGNFNDGKTASFFYWAADTSAYEAQTGTLSNRERTRYNIDPFINYYDKAGNRHKLQGRFYNVDNTNDTDQSNSTKTLYGEYQFQKQVKNIDLVTTAGLVYQGTNVEAELYGDTTFTSRNMAAYLQLEKSFFDKLNVSAGFRIEQNVLNNPGFEYDFGTISPSEDKETKPVFRLGLSYKAHDYTYLRASIGQGYRYPTIAEKYIFTNAGGFFIVPNASLESETGWSAEIGIKQGFKISSFKGFADVSAFISKYSDMMEFNLATGVLGFGLQAQNIGGTTIQGVELSLGGKGEILGLPTTLLAGYTFIDPRFDEFDDSPFQNLADATIGQQNYNSSSVKEDNILKYRFQHTAKLDLETTINKLKIGIAGQYYSNMEAIDAIFLLIVPGLSTYREANDKDFLVFNARTSYEFAPFLKGSLIWNNILNEDYSFRPGRLEAPMNVTMRLDFKF